MNDKYKNKNWLFSQYVTLKRSMRNIGLECQVDRSTISRWLGRHGIPKRTGGIADAKIHHNYKGGLYIYETWLREHYLDKQLSGHKIASICKTVPCAIYTYLRKFNIPIRKSPIGLKGKQSAGWKGGKAIHTSGYINIYNPEHPNANNAGYIFEHRLLMSEYLGRPLTKYEIIHHINGKKTDNRLENLFLENRNTHKTKYADGYRKGLTDGYNKTLYEQAFMGQPIIL